MIEKLINYITTLVFPYLGAIFAFLRTRPETQNLTPENTLYGSCAININVTDETTAFSKSLMNDLYKELLNGLLLLVIKEFKKLVKSYFARTALEKSKRRIEKIKLRFKLSKSNDKNQSSTDLSSLDPILKEN